MNTITNDMAYDPTLFSIRGTTPAKAMRAAEEFEALLINQLMKDMDATVPDDEEEDLLYSDEEQTYRGLWYQEMARTIARGEGMGIKSIVAEELIQRSAGEDNQADEGVSHE